MSDVLRSILGGMFLMSGVVMLIMSPDLTPRGSWRRVRDMALGLVCFVLACYVLVNGFLP